MESPLHQVGFLDVTAEGVEPMAEGTSPARVDSDLICVCAWCRRVRDDEAGEWVSIETYLSHGARGALVSHGICPTCQAGVGG
jgi:hypothetical protein